MPLYEFKCHECGEVQERIVPRDVMKIACPYCAEPLRQMDRLFPRRIHIGNSSQTYHVRTRANGDTLGQKFRKFPRHLAILRQRAAARGISISPEDTYHDCLAAMPLDPDAVVPHDDPLGHIKRLGQRRGHAVEGMVNVKAVEKEPQPAKGPPIAEDIVQRLMRQRVRKDPGCASTPAKRKRLREDVINRHAPQPS